MRSGDPAWTTAALAAADERNLAEAFSSFTRVPGAEVDTRAGMVRVATGMPVMNSVVHARLQPDEADQGIDETLAWFAARRVPVTWYVGPTTTPADLGPRLEAHGLAPAGAWVGMGRGLDTLPQETPMPDGCTLVHVGDEAGLREVASVATVGFGFPADLLSSVTQFVIGLGDGHGPWRFSLVREQGVAVATAGLFLGSEVAGIYFVATVPEARRRGFGAAVTLAALQEARTLGYHAAVLQASPMGHAIYRRLGFEDHCTFWRYRWTSPSA